MHVACVLVLPLAVACVLMFALPWICLHHHEFALTLSTGSMADVPKDLLQEIKRLEDLFTVPKEKLKSITEHFVKELEKGTYPKLHY